MIGGGDGGVIVIGGREEGVDVIGGGEEGVTVIGGGEREGTSGSGTGSSSFKFFPSKS